MRKISAFAILIMMLFIGCKRQIPFDKIQWNEKDDMEYPYRNEMLNDLTNNYKLKGLSKIEWHELLGEPDNREKLAEYYSILIHYDIIDPDYSKDLVLYLNKDSSVNNFEIHEWRKHK